MKAGAEALMLGRGHSQKEKREANGPQRSPEYKRIYIDFWSEGHIFSYQSIKINSGRRNLHYIPLMKKQSMCFILIHVIKIIHNFNPTTLPLLSFPQLSNTKICNIRQYQEVYSHLATIPT